jgi:hypothetical protein
MSCDCRLCRDDREAAQAWLARAAELRAEADDYERRAMLTLDRINSYPAQATATLACPEASFPVAGARRWRVVTRG